MKSVFVRALWGEDDYKLRKHLLAEADAAAKQSLQPTLWYSFGENNRLALEKVGVQSIMLSEKSIIDFGKNGQIERSPQVHGTINWGVSMWSHKYVALQHAISGHQEAVWLDLDTVLVSSLPSDFWERLRGGAAFQCSLLILHRKQAMWRPEEQRRVPCGSLMYFRGLETVERVLRIYDEMPGNWDLVILAKLVDEMMGGKWLGQDEYKRMGFEPGFHRVKSQIFAPEKVLFWSGKRKAKLPR